MGQGIERALDFKEQLLVGHPPHPHARRMQGRFNSRHQAVELREVIFVLPPRPLNALAGREAPLGPAIRLHLVLPLEVRGLMVNPGVPDEVDMQKVTHIVSGRVAPLPCQDVLLINDMKNRARVPPLPVVTVEQVSHPFRNLKPHLHAQGALRERTDQGFDRLLVAVTLFIARIQGGKPTEFIGCYKRSIQLDRHVVEQVSNS